MEASDAQPPSKRVRVSNAANTDKLSREFGLMRRDAENGTSIFVGSGSGNHFVRLVYNSITTRRDDEPPTSETPEANVVPGEDDELLAKCRRRGLKSLYAPWELLPISDCSTAVTFDDLVAWSQSYWNHWHSVFPFLHAPTVLAWFEEIASIGVHAVEKTLSPAKLTIVRAILSLSIADQRQNPHSSPSKPVSPDLVFHSFDNAVKSVERVLTDLPAIEGLQSAVAVQLYLVSMLRHNAASRVGGLVVRMLYNMGLHRCPVKYPIFSASECEMRKRIFWVVYCIDRHIGLSLGLPLTIRDDDIDVCSFDDERHGNGIQNVDNRLMVLKYLGHVFEIKGMILELCNKNFQVREDCPRGAAAIASRIARLKNDVDSIIDGNITDDSPFNESITTVFTVLQHECTISLQRPMLAGAKDTLDYRSGLQLCIGAARGIIKTLSGHLSRQRNKTTSNSAELLTWPTFTWAVWMSAFIIFYAAIESQIPKSVANRLTAEAIDVLEHLSLRGSIWPKASAEAIRDLSKRLEHVAEDGLTEGQSRPKDGSRGRDSTLPESAQTGSTNMYESNMGDGFASSGSDGAIIDQRQYVQPSSHVQSVDQNPLRAVDNTIPQDINGYTDPWMTSFMPLSSSDMTAPNIFDEIDIPFWMGQDDAFSWMDEWQ